MGIPSVEEEDLHRPSRERTNLKAERPHLINRIRHRGGRGTHPAERQEVLDHRQCLAGEGHPVLARSRNPLIPGALDGLDLPLDQIEPVKQPVEFGTQVRRQLAARRACSG